VAGAILFLRASSSYLRYSSSTVWLSRGRRALSRSIMAALVFRERRRYLTRSRQRISGERSIAGNKLQVTTYRQACFHLAAYHQTACGAGVASPALRAVRMITRQRGITYRVCACGGCCRYLCGGIYPQLSVFSLIIKLFLMTRAAHFAYLCVIAHFEKLRARTP